MAVLPEAAARCTNLSEATASGWSGSVGAGGQTAGSCSLAPTGLPGALPLMDAKVLGNQSSCGATDAEENHLNHQSFLDLKTV